MIKCAERSPRIEEDGSIRWYEGDTFMLEFMFKFSNEDGTEIPAKSTDVIEFDFINYAGQSVHNCIFEGTNSVIINMDEITTKKFKRGTYRYNVRRNSKFITTIMDKNKVVVE
jgi:hypothetical protein